MVHLTPLISLFALPVYSAPNVLPTETKSAPIKAIDSVTGGIASSDLGSKAVFSSIFASLKKIKPAAAPTSIADVVSRLARAHARAAPVGYVEMSAELISDGIVPNLDDMTAGLKIVNNPNNINTREPSSPVYPKKSAGDAPFSQTEAQMRKQIYIPSTFTYGKKQPTILVPGTGERGGNSFRYNYIKTLANKEFADVVWLNPPGYQLADAQTNSETVAYAINYISGISGNRNVSVIGWSQGTINTQWALKYWPSARKLTSVNIAHSGDYHGTIVANLITPFGAVALPPSLLQQTYNSTFTKVLRSNGGDSAYVPTTNIYSGFFDEVVEPQQGNTASGHLKDARGVGVTNADVGKVCPENSPAGAFVDHESNLFNSLTHALAVDSLKNGEAAKMSRVDLHTVCQQAAAPGLDLDDVVGTEKTIPFALVQIGLYTPKTTKEPKIRKYAL